MKLSQCDACGKVAPDLEAIPAKWIHLNWREYESSNVNAPKPNSGKFDVCPDCQMDIWKLFKKGNK